MPPERRLGPGFHPVLKEKRQIGAEAAQHCNGSVKETPSSADLRCFDR
jgi:hypothetical protein